MATHTAYLRSSVLLAEFMKTRQVDTVMLARLASIERMRHGGEPVSSQFVGRLRNKDGKVRNPVTKCAPDLAAAIETVLDVPRGLLFDVRSKSSDKRNNVASQTEAA